MLYQPREEGQGPSSTRSFSFWLPSGIIILALLGPAIGNIFSALSSPCNSHSSLVVPEAA